MSFSHSHLLRYLSNLIALDRIQKIKMIFAPATPIRFERLDADIAIDLFR